MQDPDACYYFYTYKCIEREKSPAYLITFFLLHSKTNVMAWNNFILKLGSSVSHHQLMRAEGAVAITLSNACHSICGVFLALLYNA